MSDRDDLLAWVGSELRDAEIAVHAGDATARRALWSDREPVTVFGAWKNAVGRAEVDDLFSDLEHSFSGCASYIYEVIAADVINGMGYTVGYEHTQATVDGVPRTYTLRVTQVYRREGEGWKVVHRHGDTVAEQG